MAMEVKRLGNNFFAGVKGVYMGNPLDDNTVAAICATQLGSGVLLFRDQHMDDAEQVAFTGYFGEVEQNPRSEVDRVAALGNVTIEGNFQDPGCDQASYVRANQQWCLDSQFFKVTFAAPHKV